MTGAGTVADRLERLGGRSWAQLLRAVRALPDRGAELDAVLARTTSELTGGTARRTLCDAVEAAPDVLDRLRGDGSLPVDVHAALGPADVDDVDDAADPAADPDLDPDLQRSTERVRSLRRSLDEERRRREGAEARAAAAEARADAATALRDGLEQQVADLTGELAATQETVRQAAARAERRSGNRIAELERELASERSALEGLRREHERVRGELTASRAEIEVLRDRAPAPSAPAMRHGAPGARPLVPPSALEPGTTASARWLAERAGLLLVDGYNVVLTMRPGQSLEDQRRWLVDRLRPFAARGGAKPVVVWDGARGSGRLRDTGGVEVRFTAAGTTADDEIVFAVAATDEHVLVVTDDAELQQRVTAEGGNVVATVHLLGIVEG